MSSGLVLPALIVKAPFAGALCDGVPHHDGSAKRFFKTVECRGPRAATQLQSYRGAIAIFVSASYDRADAEHLAWWYARQASKRRPPVKLSVDVAAHVHAYCAMVASAWRYKLFGFIDLQRVTTAAAATSERELLRWHAAATDDAGAWIGNVSTYLHVRALHSFQTADGLPRFDAACVGCQAKPPHSAAGCHVNVQTVRLTAPTVPKAVRERITPWHVPQ